MVKLGKRTAAERVLQKNRYAFDNGAKKGYKAGHGRVLRDGTHVLALSKKQADALGVNIRQYIPAVAGGTPAKINAALRREGGVPKKKSPAAEKLKSLMANSPAKIRLAARLKQISN